MEKVIAALWAETGGRDALNRRSLRDLAPALKELGARHIRVNVQDEAVAAGEGLRQRCIDPQPDAFVQFWLPSANRIFREPVDRALAASAPRYAIYLALESTILANRDHPPRANERAFGFAQMALLQRSARLSFDDWLAIWQDRHTRVAIDTQSTFEYVQNVLIRKLTDGAPDCAAIVEECFPIAALDDPAVFFDAAGDQAKFKRNLDLMMESCARFIEPGGVDVIPTSQYNL